MITLSPIFKYGHKALSKYILIPPLASCIYITFLPNNPGGEVTIPSILTQSFFSCFFAFSIGITGALIISSCFEVKILAFSGVTVVLKSQLLSKFRDHEIS